MRGSEPSLIRSIRGPITLIHVGVLFALNNFTQYSFDKTWPVLLIVFGLLSLLKRGMDPAPPPPPPGQTYPAPQYAYPAPSRYAQSTYPHPPPQEGGCGPSPPRPADAGQNPPPPPGDPV